MEKKISFEESMARLQEIVQKLETGEESLESSMKLFEEGAKITASCYQTLNDAEQKVAEFTKLTAGMEDNDE